MAFDDEVVPLPAEVRNEIDALRAAVDDAAAAIVDDTGVDSASQEDRLVDECLQDATSNNSFNNSANYYFNNYFNNFTSNYFNNNFNNYFNNSFNNAINARFSQGTANGDMLTWNHTATKWELLAAPANNSALAFNNAATPQAPKWINTDTDYQVVEFSNATPGAVDFDYVRAHN